MPRVYRMSQRTRAPRTGRPDYVRRAAAAAAANAIIDRGAAPSGRALRDDDTEIAAAG